MKKPLSVGLLAATLVLAGLPHEASAQRYLVDLGVNAGGSIHTNVTDEDQFSGGAAKFGAGWLLGSQLTIWPWSRVGLRANFNYADRPFEADDEIGSHINLWSGSGDLVFRLKAPNEQWQGRETLPYLALGVGRKWVNPAGDRFVCWDQGRNEFWECLPYAPTGATLALGEWKEALMILAGVGVDFRLSPRWLFRLELNDRIYKPQVQEVSGFAGGNLYAVPDGEENVAKSVHEIGLQAGFSVALFHRGGRAPVAAAPPPPPPPQQQQQQEPPRRQEPPPPPPPREDDIGVCVLDPAAEGGMRTLAAKFRHATSDTVVVQGGTPTPIRQAAPSVMTAGNADWFVRGTPFVMQMGQLREEFVAYGRPEVVPCNSLVYVGTVNAYPVYVNPNDISAYRSQLQSAASQRNGDLAAALAANRQLREQFDAVRTIYVPIDPIGPRMQALQRQEQVRKGDLD